jgi:hypothetical protein
VHDFFTEQPQKNADVYILRWILHNWSDKEAIQILRSIRTAASPKSKLLVFEKAMLHTCHTSKQTSETSSNHLLANLGVAGAGDSTRLDMKVDISHN